MVRRNVGGLGKTHRNRSKEDCGSLIQFAAKDRLIHARNYSAESTTQFRRSTGAEHVLRSERLSRISYRRDRW